MTAVLTLPIIHFEVPLEIVVLGLISGMTYGLLGVGLTLTYRASRVINFAYGEMGALPAVIVPVLVLNHGWSWWLAVPLGVAVAGGLGAATEFTVIRRLSRAPRLVVLVATLGIAQILLVANLLIPRTGKLAGGAYPTPFHALVRIGSLRLNAGHVLILVVSPLIVLALTLFLARTSVGIASRASAENRDAALLAGVPVGAVSLLVWTLAGVLAGASAILVGPTKPLLSQVALGPSLMVRALAAALIGRLANLPQVLAGGLVIGVVELLVLWNYPTGGLLEMTLFVIVLGCLLFGRGLGQLARGGDESSWALAGSVRPLARAVAASRSVATARRVAIGGAVALAALAPLPMQNSQRLLASSVVIFALIGLSVVVLTGFAGQVSLGQFAFVALGALVGGRMYQLGYPAWMGALYAIAAGALVAAGIGLAALRVRGLFLAVGTLGFALAASTWLFNQPWLVVADVTGLTSRRIPRPHALGVDFQKELPYYWLCLVAFCAVAALVHRLRNTGVGRSMVAVRDNERAAAALSVSPRRAKLTAFVVAGAIAGLGGWLYGALLVNFNVNAFGPEQSLNLVAMCVFGGVTTITGSVLGALWVRGIPYAFGNNWGLASSAAGLLLALLVFPGGLAGLVFRVRDRVVQRLMGDVSAQESPPVAARTLPAHADADATQVADDTAPLVAAGISVHFGGIAAVYDVSLTLGPGETVGLIGPNGAGKTTFFDVLSGQIPPTSGTVTLRGVDVTGMRVEQRAELGLGRSFQQARLFDGLTVHESFRLASERADRSELVPSLLGLPPSRVAERRKAAGADGLVDLLGLGTYADRRIDELSTGTRRLVELGCIVALGAEVLLLDEPMAGIAQREVEAFVPVIADVRAHLGASIVLVDHDLPMVAAIVDRVVVMASGAVVASGPPAILVEDAAVRAVYLGTDERAVRRSGVLVGGGRRGRS
jgi:ABC-type branched-subunit amino acid transport system ATPase component/ABC-type branched-subunit amino acid transport system permease subunit